MSDKDYLHVFTTTTMDPFSITIPTLPPFSLSSTPRNVPRKRINIEDHHSPAERIQENAQKDSHSLGCQECAARLPLSPSKRKNNREELHPPPPPPPFHTSTETPKTYAKHRCRTCHGEDVHPVPPGSTPPRMGRLACTETILSDDSQRSLHHFRSHSNHVPHAILHLLPYVATFYCCVAQYV